MTRSVLQDEVRKIQRKLNKTIIFVTHDMDEALSMADRIIFMDHGTIVQTATPEEMLENPANDLIRSFMGKRSKDTENQQRTAADFMYTRVYTANKNYGIHEAIDLMKRKNIDTLIITNADGTYAGIVSVKTLKDHGHDIKTIEPLITQICDTSYFDEDAQKCFEKLFNSNGSYIVILSHDNTVAGIVTKTSMAKALAEAVWR
jgi:osmoprotectant transport system ATP-binding protein